MRTLGFTVYCPLFNTQQAQGEVNTGNLKMDKSWMRCTDTSSDVYIKGVDNFLQFAFKHSEVDGEIPVPCTQCNNILNGSRADVREHLILSEIVKNYIHWLHRGESAPKKQTINQKEEGKEQGRVSCPVSWFVPLSVLGALSLRAAVSFPLEGQGSSINSSG
ncbi:uncharacterized protein LOC107849287 isoform X3 [Capsicum annuum]|uniref:uncharacterized protein LOC107849287 isoform X3 n=1 Tax=Capsicum annuum TaxID=4072 RepID=UPI001FB06C37|nr:uncharacterized protein LOC107849287 isoform X3 [Capsicum annuum]